MISSGFTVSLFPKQVTRLHGRGWTFSRDFTLLWPVEELNSVASFDRPALPLELRRPFPGLNSHHVEVLSPQRVFCKFYLSLRYGYTRNLLQGDSGGFSGLTLFSGAPTFFLARPSSLFFLEGISSEFLNAHVIIMMPPLISPVGS